jgi:hypothetical protein
MPVRRVLQIGTRPLSTISQERSVLILFTLSRKHISQEPLKTEGRGWGIGNAMPGSEAAARRSLRSLRSLASFWPQSVMAQKTKRREGVWLLSGTIPIIYLPTVTLGLHVKYRNVFKICGECISCIYALKPKIQTNLAAESYSTKESRSSHYEIVQIYHILCLDGLRTDPPTQLAKHPLLKVQHYVISQSPHSNSACHHSSHITSPL